MTSSRPLALQPGDLRGATRLVADATVAVTDLVEAVHARIARVPGLPRAPADRLGGVGGRVYGSVRGIATLVGHGLDAALAALARLDDRPHDASASREREALVAVLNGVLGHHLAATGNPLAIGMAVRVDGRALVPERAALGRALPQAGPDIVLLAHGLCMNDLQWTRNGHDHGRVLARELGFTPLYLHYNSGLHVWANGRELALQLERLVEQWPVRVRRIAVVGHSMGGLLARSALHQAREAGLRWPDRLRDLVFLGTPHHGAPLERAGNRLNTLLGAIPYAAPFARLGRVRSPGITDLRHGSLLEEDRDGRGRFDHGEDRRVPVPLPADVRCHALAATVGERVGDARDRLLGDGLVPLDSALGRHPQAERTLAFAPGRQWVGHGIGHLELLERPEVSARLLRALSPARR
jgi:hypothetical protein